jgi:excisionase family DNA binding protein
MELNIGRSLAYRLIESGALPVVRIGRALRVRRSDLDAYVEANLIRRVMSPPARDVAALDFP